MPRRPSSASASSSTSTGGSTCILAAEHDDYEETVGYDKVFETVTKVSAEQRYHILEAFAEAIARPRCWQAFPARREGARRGAQAERADPRGVPAMSGWRSPGRGRGDLLEDPSRLAAWLAPRGPGCSPDDHLILRCRHRRPRRMFKQSAPPPPPSSSPPSPAACRQRPRQELRAALRQEVAERGGGRGQAPGGALHTRTIAAPAAGPRHRAPPGARRRSRRPRVCAEMKDRPSPAITACLMVSLEPISMPMRGATPASWKKRSISVRVPEPGSRTRKAVAGDIRRADAPAGERMAGWVRRLCAGARRSDFSPPRCRAAAGP